MLIFKSMEWSNCFSYGENNKIDFNINPLTQLIGANGSGKTSISLLLQEVLYGKNHKNIKKQDIKNNKTNIKEYSIDLYFEKDKINYSVHLKRSSNLKFKLLKEGEDISSHTSLGTYKTLSNIIGIEDFKVFCQLIYQHSTDSLDFLTATDTNRKKFLISLLQLEKYIEYHEKFKNKARNIFNEINQLEGSINIIESWIERHKDFNFKKEEILEIPELDIKLIGEINTLESNLNDINNINKKIIENNNNILELDSLDDYYYMSNAPTTPKQSSMELGGKIKVVEHDIGINNQKINKISQTKGTCPTCLQIIDEIQKSNIISDLKNNLEEHQSVLEQLKIKKSETLTIENEIKKHKEISEKFIQLNQLIDLSLPRETLDKNELISKLNNLKNRFDSANKKIKNIETINIKRAAHNSKINVIKEELKQMKKELHSKNILFAEKENYFHILELLKKAFSTNGLVSYKIESSIKELEHKINIYLRELTNYQIYFKLSGEKLNIEVLDDVGNITSISNLSSGERARVNLATLLGIRNILSDLTNTKINLLFLDEITGSLDADGKEKFTDILLNENLNTFLVSHEWTHPLVPQINIVKEQNISRIEYD